MNLVLWTDGVTDARNRDGETFGEAGSNARAAPPRGGR
jgi:serine phosphatase RsbU (regulator of sigma subunit)